MAQGKMIDSELRADVNLSVVDDYWLHLYTIGYQECHRTHYSRAVK